MPKKVKVLLIAPSFTEGTGAGVIEHTLRLFKALKARNTDIEVVPLPLFNPRIVEYFNRRWGDETSKKKDFKPPFFYKPDIIHYSSPGVFFVGQLIKPLMNAKAKDVVSVHDLDALKKVPKVGVYKYANISLHQPHLRIPEYVVNRLVLVSEINGVKQAAKKADKLVSVSEYTAADVKKTLHVSDNKISVVYNIIGDNFRHVRKKNGNGKIVIGHLSSYLHNKNVKMLVDAFKKTKSKNLELHLYGGRLPFDVKGDDRIKYLGHARNLPKMYNSFDVFVFPSTWEGFGMPIMEAKKCRIPVVTYKKGQITDVVKRNTLQFKDERDLTRILDNKEWRKVDVEKAYHDAEKCSSDYVADQMVKIYKDILSEKQPVIQRT